FSPDGKLLAIGSGNKTVRLWDPRTGDPVGAPLAAHTEAVSAVAFSPDGQLLATASDDGTARLWDPSLYANPIRSLCDKAGAMVEDEWAIFAPTEPFVEICT
ncbi:WD40 repeat domain-containing protein, partial [Micromonospora sp.]|uniref:WD40 repeat domain-containing protein n=1 Tax=Micromonospora sp. TaxID=1876 RepID=UPI003B3B0901